MFNSYEGNAGFTGECNRTKMGFHTIDGVDIYCEVTQKLGPMVPMDLKRANNADIPWSRSSSSQRDRKKNKQILLLASTKARCS